MKFFNLFTIAAPLVLLTLQSPAVRASNLTDKDCFNAPVSSESDDSAGVSINPISSMSVCLDEVSNEIRSFTFAASVESTRSGSVVVYFNTGSSMSNCEAKTKRRKGYSTRFNVAEGETQKITISASGSGLRYGKSQATCYTPFFR